MELEDLKNNWEVLSKYFGKNEVINEKLVRQIITEKVVKTYDKLLNNELLGTGLVIVICIVIAVTKAHRLTPLSLPNILIVEAILIVVMLWQFTKVCFLLRVGRVGINTTDYLNKINWYARWIKGEIYASPVIATGAVGYFYISMGLYRNPLNLLILGSVFCLCIVISLYSNKNYSKNLEKIRGAIKELKEIDPQKAGN